MADRVIEIIVETNDQTGGALGNIQKSLLAMDKVVQRMQNKLRALGLQRFAATVRLIDRVTQPGSRINSFLKSLATKVYTITMRVNDAAGNKIRQIEASLMKLAGKAWTIGINVRDNVAGKVKGLTDGLLMGMGGMGVGMLGTAGIGYGVVNAAQSYMNFEQQMSRVQAVRQLDKNSSEMQALTQQAKDLGAQTAWTRQQVGEAQYYQALAGWETGQILKSTPHLLNLASAGNVDLGRASDIVTDTLTGFGIKSNETYIDKQGRAVNATEQYIDMMTKLQAISNTDVNQMSEAFKYSAPTIGAMYSKEDIQTRMQAAEDAMIMTGLMANSGIKGSLAGTGINNIFNRMASMNRNAYQSLRAMGVEYTDANGEMLLPGEIMRNLSKRFKEGVDPQHLVDFAEQISGEKIHADTRRKLDSFIEQTQKNGGRMSGGDMLKMSSMLAGTEHMGKLLAVMLGDWDAMAEKMDNVHGTAKEMADIQLDNLSGELTRLGSAWDAFQQSFFEGSAGDGLRSFVQSLTEVISRAQKLFSDGIGFGDIGKVIFDVIDRLKNKFLELDGIGSVLAGGALMGGLMKVGSMIQKTIGYFRTLRGLEIGQRLGGTSTGGQPPVGLGGGQSVGTMNVTAGVVNLNGKVNGGIGGAGGGSRRKQTSSTPPAIAAAQTNLANAQLARDKALAAAWANPGVRWQQQVLRIEQANVDKATKALINARVAAYNEQIAKGSGTPPAPPAPSRLSTMRGAAMGGAAFAAVFGALDLFNVKSMSQERSQEAAAQLAAAEKEYRELLSQGVSQSELGAQAARIAELQATQTQVAKENAANERQVAAGATGAVLGSAMGAALGSFVGPVGTMLGGIVGGIIGEKLGGAAADVVTPATQIATPVKVSTELIEQQTAKRLGINLQKDEKPLGAFDEIPSMKKIYKPPASWITDTREGQNFFGYNGEDILTTYDGKKYEPPTPWDKMPELKRGAGHGRNQAVEDNLATFEAETAQLQAEAKQRQQARWLQGDGRWHGQNYQQFDAVQAGKAALESTTELFKAQHQPKATTFSPKPTAGTWQGQSQYFSTQEQARKLNEANAATGDLTAAFKRLDDWLFNKAVAAELNPEQLAQQAAMERGLPAEAAELSGGEIATPEIEKPEGGFFDDLFNFDGVTETLSSFGEMVFETLSGAFDDVGEIFSGFGESISENLSAALDGAGEMFSGFGEIISANLTSAFDVASEMFSGFGELVTSSLAAAQSAAESALTAIGAAFDSTKSAIQSAWSELPGFFSGIFDSLGGVAAAAGAAIYSGLTSVIGAVIGAWQSAASTVSGIISSISAMASSVAGMVPSIGGGRGGAFAEGGFVTSPTQALVGEAGAEVIIPLSSSRRARAMELFEKTAAILGGDALSFGGDELANNFTPPTFDDDIQLPTSAATLSADNPVTTSTQNNSSNEISLGGIQATFNITSDNAQEVLQTIRENLAELADNVAARLAVTIDDAHHNQPLEA